MAARVLAKIRDAQSLLRECHGWVSHNSFRQFHFKFYANFLDEQLVQNEFQLAAELCQMEGRLEILSENRCFANSPCPGIQDEELSRLVSTEYSMPSAYGLNADIMSPTASLSWLQTPKPPRILQRLPQTSSN